MIHIHDISHNLVASVAAHLPRNLRLLQSAVFVVVRFDGHHRAFRYGNEELGVISRPRTNDHPTEPATVRIPRIVQVEGGKNDNSVAIFREHVRGNSLNLGGVELR